MRGGSETVFCGWCTHEVLPPSLFATPFGVLEMPCIESVPTTPDPDTPFQPARAHAFAKVRG